MTDYSDYHDEPELTERSLAEMRRRFREYDIGPWVSGGTVPLDDEMRKWLDRAKFGVSYELEDGTRVDPSRVRPEY